MILCYLALGSNLDTPRRQLHRAIKQLSNLPRTQLIDIASFYSSKAWGRKTQPDFCNTVVAIRTTLTPDHLLKKCNQIEKIQGRKRQVKWGARTLDIDILLYGQININKPHLTIPHSQLLKRDFVILPLLEIAPSACMANGQLIAELSREVTILTSCRISSDMP